MLVLINLRAFPIFNFPPFSRWPTLLNVQLTIGCQCKLRTILTIVSQGKEGAQAENGNRVELPVDPDGVEEGL